MRFLRYNMLGLAILIGTLVGVAGPTAATDLTFEFKNPAFSGNGYSNHVLSIEQLQFQRAKEVKDKAAADAAKAKRDAASTTLAKFLKNVESRIYAQLSKQMVDNMFTDDGSTTGTATIEGATINWVKDVTTDTITITITGDDGTVTEIAVPLTGFGF